MNVDLCSMANATGIPVETLASVLGPRPIVTSQEMVTALENAQTMRQVRRLMDRMPRGTPFRRNARQKLAWLYDEAVSKAKKASDWHEILRYGAVGQAAKDFAEREISSLYQSELREADTLEKLRKLYGKFNLPGNAFRKFRQDLIRRMAEHFPIPG